MKRKLLKNKRGFTLVETVVALALILIVSATSLTLISSANNATQRALFNAKAQNFVSDVVTVYRTAEDRQQFNDIVYATENNMVSKLAGGYTYTIQIVDKTLTVTVFNESGKQIANAEYVRGVALS